MSNYYWIVGNGRDSWLEKVTDYVPEADEIKTLFRQLKLSAHVSSNAFIEINE